jgi:hypothetical protein
VDLESADFFTDTALVSDPYPYFDALRSRCPVHPVVHPGVVAVTGYDEAVEVFKDGARFSSCNSAAGPFPPLQVPPGVDDVTDLIEAHRDQWPLSEFMVTMDGSEHEAQRSLLRRLLTPRRLKENEAALAGIADRCIDEFITAGRCEVVNEYGKPFTTLAIADLLGVPEEDRAAFREVLAGSSIGVVGDEQTLAVNPLEYMFGKFTSTSRIVDVNPVRMFSPNWRLPPTPTVRCPSPMRSCARQLSCSERAKTLRRACCAPPFGSSLTTTTFKSAFAASGA